MKCNNATDMPEGHRNQLKALPMAKSGAVWAVNSIKVILDYKTKWNINICEFILT